VRALIVTGAGAVFSAGFDLKEFDTAFADEAFATRLWASSDEWHHRWIEFPVPTIAAVNGAAIAGGFDVAVMCDLRVVADTATFAHPEIRFGDVVYGPLHDLVGGSVARDLSFTGRRIDGDEAYRLGLANRLVAADQILSTALEVANEVALAPRDTLVRLKAKATRRAGVTQAGTLDL
jgi:enoyl-CoA hydratase